MTSDHPVKRRKKLIEVAIPLEAINAASAHDKAIRRGHPRNIHYWFAPRPLAAALAVIYCQCVDDPSALPDEFPTPQSQENERIRLFRVICNAIEWENHVNPKALGEARAEIIRSWQRCCTDNREHPEAETLFNPDHPPQFHDGFAGGGAIPLEAQALGFEVLASDLNPVAVLINKALIEVPPQFADSQPIRPNRDELRLSTDTKHASGLCEDISYYAQTLIDRTRIRVCDFYPPIQITSAIIKERPDLAKYADMTLPCVGWIWARTVLSPDPAYSHIKVPLASTFILTSNEASRSWIEPVVSDAGYSFKVSRGSPPGDFQWKTGTKVSGANFRCLLSGSLISAKHIREQAKNGAMGEVMMAIVLQGDKERVYISPTIEQVDASSRAKSHWKPDTSFLTEALGFRVGNYGMTKWGDLYTERQALALATLCDELASVEDSLRDDLQRAFAEGRLRPSDWDSGKVNEYVRAVKLYLAIAISKTSNRSSSLCTFKSGVQCPGDVFSRQTLSMTWDFCEANIIDGPSGSFLSMVDTVISGLKSISTSSQYKGSAFIQDVAKQPAGLKRIISTDPPYFDNIGYADLSDYFYTWLRRALKQDFPELFGTIETPKSEELVATPARHGGKKGANSFFLEGMKRAVSSIAANAHPSFPITIYYAFKQSETTSANQSYSSGWEAFLDAVIDAGLVITSAWPINTERANRKRGQDSNALSSSIVISCGLRDSNASYLSSSEFRRGLRTELPLMIDSFIKCGISPADMPQAAIGQGMSIFSGAKGVLNPDDSPMSVRQALIEINAALDDYLSKEEGELDADSRFALTFFESFGFRERDYGDAESLALARNISVDGVSKAGILRSVAGKVRLLERSELPKDWDPIKDKRLCVWEATQHMIKRLETGEQAAADLLAKLKGIPRHGDLASSCRSLAYRLYNHCEKTKQAEEARAYNGLLIAWPELEKLATDVPGSVQSSFL